MRSIAINFCGTIGRQRAGGVRGGAAAVPGPACSRSSISVRSISAGSSRKKRPTSRRGLRWCARRFAPACRPSTIAARRRRRRPCRSAPAAQLRMGFAPMGASFPAPGMPRWATPSTISSTWSAVFCLRRCNRRTFERPTALPISDFSAAPTSRWFRSSWSGRSRCRSSRRSDPCCRLSYGGGGLDDPAMPTHACHPAGGGSDRGWTGMTIIGDRQERE